MKFYNGQFKKIRKEQRYSATDFCKIMGISRSTLWEWESGKRIPSESVIRRLAEILKVDASKISNLKDELKIVNADFSRSEDAVRSLFKVEPEYRENKFSGIIHEIINLKEELEQATVIINALLTTMNTMFYIKDSNLKYVIANSNFLLNLSLPEDYQTKGKVDKDFFPNIEAEQNTKNDKEVLYTKKPIITQEGYIPGTRKKKWGLISKIPIFDSKNNATGIVGTFVDITERMKYDEIRRLLEIALNRSSFVVWLLRPYPHYKLFYISKSVLELYGYNAEKFLTTKDFWLNNCVHPEDREKLEKSWISGKISEMPEKRVFRIICPGEKIKYIESTLINTKINESVAYIEREITARHKDSLLQEKLKIAQALKKENVDLDIVKKTTGVDLLH